MTTQRVGKVVRVNGDQIPPIELVVNLGSADGVSTRDIFLVYAIGDEIRDPDTGESLGSLEIVRGRGKAKHIQPNMTTITALTRKKHVIRKEPSLVTGRSSLGLSTYPWPPTEVVEEAEEEIPFEAVNVGDLVRVL